MFCQFKEGNTIAEAGAISYLQTFLHLSRPSYHRKGTQCTKENIFIGKCPYPKLKYAFLFFVIICYFFFLHSTIVSICLRDKSGHKMVLEIIMFQRAIIPQTHSGFCCCYCYTFIQHFTN